jgi:hypothetical protein
MGREKLPAPLPDQKGTSPFNSGGGGGVTLPLGRIVIPPGARGGVCASPAFHEITLKNGFVFFPNLVGMSCQPNSMSGSAPGPAACALAICFANALIADWPPPVEVVKV